MQHPPFKLASAHGTVNPWAGGAPAPCCDGDAARPDASATRSKLMGLDPHYHCSVIGTCLGTAELRKIAGRFVEVQGLSDLQVHHESVLLASEPTAARVLHKALDQRHAATVARFTKARDGDAILALWDEAMKQGDIPGAYWALLTHRDATTAIRSKAFGDVHMLSHLVGAANRADIRRLVALEQDNAELRERVERQSQRSQQLALAHEQVVERLQEQLAKTQGQLASAQRTDESADEADRIQRIHGDTPALVAVQTERRERAERALANALADAARLDAEMRALRQHIDVQAEELSAAEKALRQLHAPEADPGSAVNWHLQGRRVLYVGGRPSSTPAIRALVTRQGGEFHRHGGGSEDRKGLLESAVSAADLVVFPVDCIDHDSAGHLKRLCVRDGIPFFPMRKASVASFAAALSVYALGLGHAPPGN